MAHQFADARIHWTAPFSKGVLAEVRLVTAAALFVCASLVGLAEDPRGAHWMPLLGVWSAFLLIAILRLAAAVNVAHGVGADLGERCARPR